MPHLRAFAVCSSRKFITAWAVAGIYFPHQPATRCGIQLTSKKNGVLILRSPYLFSNWIILSQAQGLRWIGYE